MEGLTARGKKVGRDTLNLTPKNPVKPWCVVCSAVSAEAKMLKGMRDQLRCCVATIGDGAAADAELYKDLYGSILIWIGTQREPGEGGGSVCRGRVVRG